MFALPGVLGLIVFLYTRPFDVFHSLRGIPALQLFLLSAMIGVLLDLRLGFLKVIVSPLSVLVVAWAIWGVLVTATKGSAVVTPIIGPLVILLIVYFLIAQGVQTIKGFRTLLTSILLCLAVLTAVCIHQSTRPLSCVALDPRDPVEGDATPDGRRCESANECQEDAPVDAEYVCEKVGLFNIYSDGRGRVRYTGTLRDPNELALAVSLAIPILFFLYEMRRTAFRGTLCLLGAIAVFYCVVQTGSRGGVLVVGSILMVMAVRFFGWRGVLVAMILVSPVALVGGRSGAEADESSMERLEAAFVGLLLLRSYPLNGAGFGQFGEHHTLTAHNAYILTEAELGYFGGILWTMLLYLAAKIALKAYLRYRDVPEAITVSRMGFVLVTSFAGLAVGVFFLSFAYHYVFWIYLGVTSALYNVIKARDPDFEVTLEPREFAIVGGIETLVLILYYGYVKTKLAG